MAELILPNLMIHISGNGDPEEVRSNLEDLAGILTLQGLNVLSISVQEVAFEVKFAGPAETRFFKPDGSEA